MERLREELALGELGLVELNEEVLCFVLSEGNLEGEVRDELGV